MSQVNINDLTNLTSIANGDKLVGERVDGTTVRITFNGTDITTLGTVTTGVWNAAIVDVAYGGSGRASATPYRIIAGGTTSTGAHQSLNPGAVNSVLFSQGASALAAWSAATFPGSAVQGDLMYSDSLNSWSTLAKNTSATRYLSNTGASNAPAWAQVNLSNGVTGTLSLTTGVTGTLPVANGGTGVTSLPTTPTASSLASWDSSTNFSANNFIVGYATTITAATTTTLTVASPRIQYFTGSTTQTIKLPVASTLAVGHDFKIVNLSSGTLTVQSSGSNTVVSVLGNNSAIVTCVLASGTTAASWDGQTSYNFINVLSVAQGGTSASSAGIAAFNNITGYSAAGATGTTSTNLVFSTSPTLTTPNIGVATGTSFNSITGLAAQSDQETSTSTVLAVSPGRQQFHPSAAKVWALFNTVTTTTLTVSYNVSSLTDTAVGQTTVNFTTAFSTANYAVIGNSIAGGTATIVNPQTFATGSILIRVFTTGSTDTDSSNVSMAAWGDQ